jgi:AcrR family transcriptional regulator
MSSESPSTRDRLCEAALRTATRDGILAMTLDNVAKEAGVSKGGVMYHFHTKDELVQAMLRYFGQRAEAMLAHKVANDPLPDQRWARAFLSCVYPEPGETTVEPTAPPGTVPFTPEAIEQFLFAMIAAAVNSPDMLSPLKSLADRLRQTMLAEGDTGMDQLLVWLALDGLFLWQFIGLIDRQDPLFQQIGDALRQRINARDHAELPVP